MCIFSDTVLCRLQTFVSAATKRLSLCVSGLKFWHLVEDCFCLVWWCRRKTVIVSMSVFTVLFAFTQYIQHVIIKFIYLLWWGYELLPEFESTWMYYEFCHALLPYGIATSSAWYRYGSLCHVTWFSCLPFNHVKIRVWPLLSKFFLPSVYRIFWFSSIIAILKAGT